MRIFAPSLAVKRHTGLVTRGRPCNFFFLLFTTSVNGECTGVSIRDDRTLEFVEGQREIGIGGDLSIGTHA